jgi:hypothetical protein
MRLSSEVHASAVSSIVVERKAVGFWTNLSGPVLGFILTDIINLQQGEPERKLTVKVTRQAAVKGHEN